MGPITAIAPITRAHNSHNVMHCHFVFAIKRKADGYDVTYFRAGVRGANLNDRPEAF